MNKQTSYQPLTQVPRSKEGFTDWQALQGHVAYTLAQAKEKLKRTPGFGHISILPITRDVFNLRNVRIDLILGNQGMWFVDLLLTETGHGNIVGIPMSMGGNRTPFNMMGIARDFLRISDQDEKIVLTKDTAEAWWVSAFQDWLIDLDRCVPRADEEYDIVHYGCDECGQLRFDSDAISVVVPENASVVVYTSDGIRTVQDKIVQVPVFERKNEREIGAILHALQREIEASPWDESAPKCIAGQVISKKGTGWLMARRDGRTIVPFANFDE